MKILVFSDSHGSKSQMLRATELEKPQIILHLGDGIDDLDLVALSNPDVEIIRVRGNCDAGGASKRALLTFGGKRFFMTHGSEYGVKYDFTRLWLAATGEGADIILYGHTHASVCDIENGVHILNPGSIGFNGTYGLVELDGDSMTCHVKSVRY